MRTFLIFTTKAFLLFSLALLALPCAAQSARPTDPPSEAADPNRQSVLRALAQDNAAEAAKLLKTFQLPNKFSTSFEEIKACGFYPQETRLECILDIKGTSGYNGPPTGLASHEFVTFCVDWNCDGSFTDDEAVGYGMVHMHDEIAGAGPVWQYAVYRDIDPPGSLSQKCLMRTNVGGNPVLTTTRTTTIKARAILSWFQPVTSCNSVPFWGNVVDFRLRLDPIR